MEVRNSLIASIKDTATGDDAELKYSEVFTASNMRIVAKNQVWVSVRGLEADQAPAILARPGGMKDIPEEMQIKYTIEQTIRCVLETAERMGEEAWDSFIINLPTTHGFQQFFGRTPIAEEEMAFSYVTLNTGNSRSAMNLAKIVHYVCSCLDLMSVTVDDNNQDRKELVVLEIMLKLCSDRSFPRLPLFCDPIDVALNRMYSNLVQMSWDSVRSVSGKAHPGFVPLMSTLEDSCKKSAEALLQPGVCQCPNCKHYRKNQKIDDTLFALGGDIEEIKGMLKTLLGEKS